MATSLLIPFADVSEERTRVLDWLLVYYETNFPDFEIIVEQGPTQNFSKTQVLNKAVERSSGDVLICMDADCLMSASTVSQAVMLAEMGQYVMPYSAMWRIGQTETGQILTKDPASFDPTTLDPQTCVEQQSACSMGALVQVLPRPAYDAIGRFPEEFVGWGNEDTAMRCSIETMYCPAFCMDVPAFHLWHRRPGEVSTGAQDAAKRFWPGQTQALPNLDRKCEYVAAMGDSVAMGKLLGLH